MSTTQNSKTRTARQNRPAREAAEVKAKVTAGMALSTQARRELLARVDSLKGKAQDLTVEAAKVSLAVKRSGLIGKGEGCEWKTQGDYAAALGVSNGTVSGWLNLAVAMERGIVPGHRDWPAVYAARQSIGKAVAPKDGKTPTVKAIVAAAKDSARSRQSGPSVPSPRNVDKNGKATPAPDGDDLMAQVRAALDVVGKAAKVLDGKDRSAVRSRLATLLAEYGGKVESTPTNPTATPSQAAAGE